MSVEPVNAWTDSKGLLFTTELEAKLSDASQAFSDVLCGYNGRPHKGLIRYLISNRSNPNLKKFFTLLSKGTAFEGIAQCSVYQQGADERKAESDHITYGIHVAKHANMIEVHKEFALRDLILKLLQQNEHEEKQYNG